MVRGHLPLQEQVLDAELEKTTWQRPNVSGKWILQTNEGPSDMAYWLFKSEPGTWSWNDQTAKGDMGEEWDGVRNHQARNHMRAMKVGDLGFFYHSGRDREIVGVVEVCAEAHPDSTTDDPRWECVDIKAVKSLKMAVTLRMCREDPRLKDMVLVNNSRLSVQPVTSGEWQAICRMGGIDP